MHRMIQAGNNRSGDIREESELYRLRREYDEIHHQLHPGVVMRSHEKVRPTRPTSAKLTPW